MSRTDAAAILVHGCLPADFNLLYLSLANKAR
jgi:hypothetical protein